VTLNRLHRAGLAGALILATASGLSACGGGTPAQASTAEQPAAPRGTPVEVAAVERGTLAPVYLATGSLEAEREAVLLAEVAGEVVSIEVEEGDRVVAGQVLARVDNAKQALELRRVATEADRMQHDVARNQRLIERQMISREAFDRTRYEAQTQGAVVDLKRLEMDKTAIRAPYAGVVTRRFIKDGQWLKLQDQAFAIADFDALQARIDVPERSAALIEAGAPVRFEADAIPGRAFEARVARIAPVVDRASGTVAAVVEIDNRDGALRPGLFVRLGVNYERIADALLAPRAAVVENDGVRHVFVVADGKAQRRTVQLGLADGDRVQVLDGLAAGDQVVVVGQNTLTDGAAVQPLAPVQAEPRATTAAL
jgi:membrane fusion protein (multidrug efflux system)